MSSAVETAFEVRPFHVEFPEELIDDLRRRIAATHWPEQETVADRSQGVQLEVLQALTSYWLEGTRPGGADEPPRLHGLRRLFSAEVRAGFRSLR